jgi:hypothetical protein
MKIVKDQRQLLEQAAGLDGGVDAELFCFEQSRPDCTRCQNSRRVGDPAFPVACPSCSKSRG